MPTEIKGEPPPPQKRKLWIKNVTTAETQEFVVISKVPYGVYSHWWGGRSHECTQVIGKCTGCTKGWPTRWNAFIYVMASPTGEIHFLEISPDCFLQLSSKMPDRQMWRGQRIRIKRTKAGLRGRYLTEVLEQRIFESALPEEEDVLPVLQKLWRLKKGDGQE